MAVDTENVINIQSLDLTYCQGLFKNIFEVIARYLYVLSIIFKNIYRTRPPGFTIALIHV